MTDKQIIIYKKECYNEPHCSLNQVLEQLKAKEQECDKLRNFWSACQTKRAKTIDQLGKVKRELEHVKGLLTVSNKLNQALLNVRDELKKELEVAKGLAEIRHQCLEAVKELTNNANLPNVGLYIDSFLNEMFNKDENCHFDKIKELTKEM